jgi:hypothetical protein
MYMLEGLPLSEDMVAGTSITGDNMIGVVAAFLRSTPQDSHSTVGL